MPDKVIFSLCCALTFMVVACGANDATAPSIVSPNEVMPVDTGSPAEDSSPTKEPFLAATLGEPISGYQTPVDMAIRRTTGSTSAQTYIAEQQGLVREVSPDGRPGRVVADLTALTQAGGEQGLLGLAFDNAGSRAFVNYTDLDGNTKVDQLVLDADGTFAGESRQNLYTVDQPYGNHNGGDLLVMPDGDSLLIFNGDGGSSGDPERRALDPSSDHGKIMQIDISSSNSAPRFWARGLRNPWRASYDERTQSLWIADVGKRMWEEINVVALKRSEGASFGWSAREGAQAFNDDQEEIHTSVTAVDPIYVYPHENGDCSISGGFVYRGTEIPHVGSWYFFADYCSGEVRALCVLDADPSGEIATCGVISLGKVENPVGIMPDASGRPWVLSHSGSIVPIVPAS